MRKLKFNILCALLAAFAFGTQAQNLQQGDSVLLVYDFEVKESNFLLETANNKTVQKQLFTIIDTYRQDIESGKVPVYVNGYCSSFDSRKENLNAAYIRAQHVKSDLILKKGLKEDNFITHKFAAPYNGKSDIVIVVLKVKADEQKPVVKEEPKVEPKKEEPKPVVKEEPKVEPKKEEPKPVVKEEPKPVAKEEPKVEPKKEEPKPVVKEEPKPVAKEEQKVEPKKEELKPAAQEPAQPVITKDGISGKILSSLNEPIEGAIVSATDAQNATTGADGAFTIKIPEGNKEISVWADGYYSAHQLLNGRENVVVVMRPESSNKYSESVVLPFRVEDKKDANTSAANINKKDFTLGSQRIDRALSGQVAGLQSKPFGGMPGEGSYLNLRGIRSFVGNNAPLVVVNGVPYLPDNKESQLLSGYTRDIFQAYNIYDLENITVLKGAEASMYGSLGSNGVILIETDGATSNDLSTRVSFYGQYGSAFNNKRLPMMNAAQYQSYLSDVGMTYYNVMEDMFAQFPFLSNPNGKYQYLYNHDTDWQSLIYRNGFVTDNLFRIEGGDAIAKYDLSLGYALENGLLLNTDAQRYHTQLNTNILVSKKVEIFATVGLAYLTGQKQEQGLENRTNPVYAAYLKSPVLSPYNYDQYGNELIKLASYNYGISTNMDFASTNPLAAVATIDAHNRQYDMNIKAGLTYKPNVNLSFTGTMGLFYNYNNEHLFIPGVNEPSAILPLSDRFGEARNLVREGIGETLNFYFNANGRYNKTFDDIHKVNILAGYQALLSHREYDGGSGRNTASDFYQTLKDLGANNGRYFFGYLEQWNWLNMYAHADYTYSDKVAVSVNMAVDGASSSGSDGNRLFAYPSAGLTWLGKGWLALSNSTLVNRLNVRAEYGLTGNSYFSSNYGKYYYTSAPFMEIAGIVRGAINNTQLKPEKNAQFNLGLDASLFHNMVDITVDYYNGTASDVIMPVPQSSVYGTAGYYENCGVINNSGVEVSVQASVVRERGIEWIVGGNIAANKAVIKSLGGADQIITEYADGAQLVSKVGEAPYQFYGYRTLGVFSKSQEAADAGLVNRKGQAYGAGDMHYENQNTDNVINDKDRVLLGSATPDFFGGLFTDIRVMGFSLSAEFVYSQGNQAYNGVRRSLESLSSVANQTLAATNRWGLEGQETDVPRAVWGDPIGNSDFSDRWIEDASYIRLKHITLSYTFDKKVLNFFRSGTFYVTGENLWTYTKYLGLDPEFSYSYSDAVQGFDYAKLLQPQVVKFGVNLKF
jgi:TonB-linked SusC/RagA family outer membrane protein